MVELLSSNSPFCGQNKFEIFLNMTKRNCILFYNFYLFVFKFFMFVNFNTTPLPVIYFQLIIPE